VNTRDVKLQTLTHLRNAGTVDNRAANVKLGRSAKQCSRLDKIKREFQEELTKTEFLLDGITLVQTQCC